MHAFSRGRLRRLAIPLAALAFALLPPAANAATGDVQPLTATADLYDKITARDLDGLARYLPADGFTEFAAGAGTTMRLDRHSFASWFRTDVAIDLHAEHLAVQEFGDTAIVTGLRVGSMTPKGQQPQPTRWALTMVWTRTEGRWLVRHVHLSTFAPAGAGR